MLKHAKQIARVNAEMARYSDQLTAQMRAWSDEQRRKATVGGMFPSTEPGTRGATSPLDGRSPGIWSGTPEKGKR
jgi:hypothetical protein